MRHVPKNVTNKIIKKGTSQAMWYVIGTAILFIIMLALIIPSKTALENAGEKTDASQKQANAQTYCYQQCLLCFTNCETCDLKETAENPDRTYTDKDGKTIEELKCSDIGADGGTSSSSDESTEEIEGLVAKDGTIVSDTPDSDPTTTTIYDTSLYELNDDDVTSVIIPSTTSKTLSHTSKNNYNIEWMTDTDYYAIETDKSFCEYGWLTSGYENYCDKALEYTYEKEKSCFYDNPDRSNGCEFGEGWDLLKVQCRYLHRDTLPASQQCKNWECTDTGWQPTDEIEAEAWCDNLEGYELKTTNIITSTIATCDWLKPLSEANGHTIDEEIFVCYKPAPSSPYTSYYCKSNLVYVKECNSNCATDDTGLCA